MTSPLPYVLFDGNAREALTRYAEVFGGDLALFSYADFNRTDGPADAIAHGELKGPVTIAGADAGPSEESVKFQGLMLALLGTAEEATLRGWFEELAVGGTVRSALAVREWGDIDGQLEDRFGVRWLIGFAVEGSSDKSKKAS